MARIKRLVIPLEKAERKALEAWAERERLPMATAARRVLLDVADRRGLLDLSGASNGKQTQAAEVQ